MLIIKIVSLPPSTAEVPRCTILTLVSDQLHPQPLETYESKK